MDKTNKIKKIFDKDKVKGIVKKVSVGAAIAGVSFVGYKVGYRKAVTRCDLILNYVINDNPEIGESFKEAWDGSINKLMA